MTDEQSIVVAVLYKSCLKLATFSGSQLTRVLDSASKKHGAIFLRFRAHPQYRYSEVLCGVLMSLMLGGGLCMVGPSLKYQLSARTQGSWGKKTYRSLSPHERGLVDQVATDFRKLVIGPRKLAK